MRIEITRHNIYTQRSFTGEIDRDKVVQNTTEDILKSLPELYNINKVKMFYGDKCFAPNIIVLLHELEKINALLDVIRNNLSQLSKVKASI